MSNTPSTTPSDLATVQRQVNEFLVKLCRERRSHADKIHENYGRLWESITDYIEGGGKRLRPYLVVLSYEAFGGNDRSAIIPVACAWELIHAALLVHDDIIDRDYVRHGHPNIAGRFLEYYETIDSPSDRRHHANSSALLAGDLLLSESYSLLFESSFKPRKIKQACELLQEALFTVVGGELLDVEASVLPLSVTPQLIAEAKTASYSMIGPLLTGASLADASDAKKIKLKQLGLVLGVGFQYVDDVLGIFGDEAVTGKSVLSDLEEGKRTFVVAEALELMTTEKRERAERLLREPSEVHATELRRLITETNVKEAIALKIEAFQNEATDLIRQLDLPDRESSAFNKLSELILKRHA